MDPSPVLVGFGRWLKGGRMLSVVLKILPLGEKQTEVAAVFERTEHYRPTEPIDICRSSGSKHFVGTTGAVRHYCAPPSPMRLGAPPRILWHLTC
jgi:hypothetical protein